MLKLVRQGSNWTRTSHQVPALLYQIKQPTHQDIVYQLLPPVTYPVLMAVFRVNLSLRFLPPRVLE